MRELAVRSVAVIVPARNAANHLPLQLGALSRQTYTGRWTVVVADNGSTDGTSSVAESWRGALPGLTVIDATAVAGPGGPARVRGPGHARNAGAAAVRDDVDAIAFCDADDIVDPDWLRNLVAALECHPVVGGRLEYGRLNPPAAVRWHETLQSERLPDSFGFLPYAISANLGVRAAAFWSVGGFDEAYVTGSDDVDLCWRLQQAGHTLGFAGDAVVHYLHRTTLSGLARQGYGYGVVQPMLYRRHREQGMRWKASDATVPWARLGRDALRVAARRASGRRWVRDVAFRVGRAVGSVRHRVLYF